MIVCAVQCSTLPPSHLPAYVRSETFRSTTPRSNQTIKSNTSKWNKYSEAKLLVHPQFHLSIWNVCVSSLISVTIKQRRPYTCRCCCRIIRRIDSESVMCWMFIWLNTSRTRMCLCVLTHQEYQKMREKLHVLNHFLNPIASVWLERCISALLYQYKQLLCEFGPL